ncbi:MAG: phosphohistidine phosphatase SixA [Kiloniellales bacterium]|nr:phosphohistidine phosphatase SixA [Kiloniellales bacterium]
MRLYLVRHGDALRSNVDPERRLSEAGQRQVGRLAAFLAERGVRVARVLHSGKPRAEQTAEALAAAVAPGVVPEARDGLSPNDPVEPLVGEVAAWQEDCLIAGHLPHLARLATLLLAGRDVPTGLDFEPAAAACLERDEDGVWSLLWLVGPSLL